MAQPTPPQSNGSRPELPAISTAKRSHTAPESQQVTKRDNHSKRIVVFCDGTWQDGLEKSQVWEYTNVLKLARAVNFDDQRYDPPVPQVVFYQSGVGTDNYFFKQVIDGATGASLAEKVQEAYAFIAHNYKPGDEIFLFGFSRGAYTARMVGAVIGEIGVLDRQDMNHFRDIFYAFQKRGTTTDKKELAKLEQTLQPWTGPNSSGRRRADSDGDDFTVKCIGVFDTVGALGIPGQLFKALNMTKFYGFNDKQLGAHVERAVQALALHENRYDFDCAKFEQTELGRSRNQLLKQCWFSGCHSDVGGGYESHDLADISLMWMAANVGDILSLDTTYLASLPNPVAPWGEQKPHDPRTGVFILADTIQRKIPTKTDEVTHETIHPSVLKQKVIASALDKDIRAHPELICTLMPLEEEVKLNWKVITENLSPTQLKAHEHICGSPLATKSPVDGIVHEGPSPETVLKDAGTAAPAAKGDPQLAGKPSWIRKIIQEFGQ